MQDNEAAKQLRDFLNFIIQSPASDEGGLPELFFSHARLGGVALGREEAHRFHRLCDNLAGAFPNRRYLTRKTIERLLQEAVLTALNDEAQGTPPGRVEDAVKGFKIALQHPPEAWLVRMPVSGLAVQGRPFRFGCVAFRRPDTARRESIASVRRLTQLTRNSTAERRNLFDQQQAQIDETCRGHSVAEIRVDALDSNGAVTEARRISDHTSSLMNFFASLLVRGEPMAIEIGRPAHPPGAPDFVWRRPTNFAPTRACSCGSQITSGDPLAGVVRRPVIRRAADRHPPPLSPRNRLDLRSLATQRSGAADSRGRTNSGAPQIAFGCGSFSETGLSRETARLSAWREFAEPRIVGPSA